MDLSSTAGSLKLSLKRGALVTAANWQVVLVQFVADTLFKTLLAVPIVGGLVLVALVVGGDPVEIIRLEPSQIVSTMVGVLLAQPFALAAFLVALGLILSGGSVLMFAIKAGSVTVLLAGERAAGPIEQPPLRLSSFAQAVIQAPQRLNRPHRISPRFERVSADARQCGCQADFAGLNADLRLIRTLPNAGMIRPYLFLWSEARA